MSWALVWSLLKLPFAAIGKGLAALARWTLEDARHVAIVVLVAVLLATAWGWRGAAQDRDAARAQAVQWQGNAERWQTAHEKLIADVAAARAVAEAQDRANLARVKAEMAAVNERAEDALQDRLDDTDAALERVRRDLAAARAAAGASDAGTAAVPGRLAAACRALGAADCDALLAALPDLLAEAERNTATLIALQDWARGVAALDLDGAAEPEAGQ